MLFGTLITQPSFSKNWKDSAKFDEIIRIRQSEESSSLYVLLDSDQSSHRFALDPSLSKSRISKTLSMSVLPLYFDAEGADEINLSEAIATDDHLIEKDYGEYIEGVIGRDILQQYTMIFENNLYSYWRLVKNFALTCETGESFPGQEGTLLIMGDDPCSEFETVNPLYDSGQEHFVVLSSLLSNNPIPVGFWWRRVPGKHIPEAIVSTEFLASVADSQELSVSFALEKNSTVFKGSFYYPFCLDAYIQVWRKYPNISYDALHKKVISTIEQKALRSPIPECFSDSLKKALLAAIKRANRLTFRSYSACIS